ncbi:MAG: sigma-70 family RNA polymerase sigma factor [Polyangiaceae bacterium]
MLFAPASSQGRSGTDASTRSAAALVEALYRQHHLFVFRLALRYGRGQKAWAEDVTQEVFLELMRAIDVLKDVEHIEPWLYTVTTRRCFQRLKRERFLSLAPVRWILGEREQAVIEPDALLDARNDLKRAFEALEALPPKERVAFSMYHLDGKSQDEIGEVLGHGKSYVCKLIQRAVELLRGAGWEVSDV